MHISLLKGVTVPGVLCLTSCSSGGLITSGSGLRPQGATCPRAYAMAILRTERENLLKLEHSLRAPELCDRTTPLCLRILTYPLAMTTEQPFKSPPQATCSRYSSARRYPPAGRGQSRVGLRSQIHYQATRQQMEGWVTTGARTSAS